MIAIAAIVITAYFAYWQWKTARDNLRIALFDKRFCVYSAFLAASKAALAKNPERAKITLQFVELLWQADFLFDKKIGAFLQQTNDEIAKLIAFEDDLEDRKSQSSRFDAEAENYDVEINEIMELHQKLMKRREEAIEIFKPFMSFEMIRGA
jgi:hypothetical protein